jgi:hypothetical protein
MKGGRVDLEVGLLLAFVGKIKNLTRDASPSFLGASV